MCVFMKRSLRIFSPIINQKFPPGEYLTNNKRLKLVNGPSTNNSRIISERIKQKKRFDNIYLKSRRVTSPYVLP